MPELPEVETVRSVLASEILHLKINTIDIFYDKMINDVALFKEELINSEIIDIKRYGKFLVFELSNDYDLISHLRMEGKYFFVDEDYPIGKHIHVVFHFGDGKKLCYMDTRKFGRMIIVKRTELFINTPLATLAPEPMDARMTKELLFNKLHNSNTAIKTLLLNQTIMAGLGNIYVDEVLFQAKINPNRSGKSITKEESLAIIEAAKAILAEAIIHKGTTIRSYTSSLGVTGSYQDFLKVHTKKECPICKAKLEKKKINGRTSYYCLNCQK